MKVPNPACQASVIQISQDYGDKLEDSLAILKNILSQMKEVHRIWIQDEEELGVQSHPLPSPSLVPPQVTIDSIAPDCTSSSGLTIPEPIPVVTQEIQKVAEPTNDVVVPSTGLTSQTLYPTTNSLNRK